MSGKKERNSWAQEDLTAAVDAVKSKRLSSYKAAEAYNIPRRTLRDYLKSGMDKRKLGRKSILSPEQERDFVQRIIRFSDLGIPLTSKMIRKQVYIFCEVHNIQNNFNKRLGLAGRDWLKLFLKRNKILAKRKAQFLNQARGQKLNKVIVKWHFDEVGKLYEELGIHYSPERIYNMDEKGCRLTMHRQPTVVAQKGAKRVHIQASEHGENVTVVGCGNAVGNVIPPMVIFKGVRSKAEFEIGLPPGSIVKMAPKGSMTTNLFIDFLRHFSKYKVSGKCLLIFDGAKCHLDYRIAEEADVLGITLYCLPSNTTHELQPLDKACYKAFETYWDQEVLQHFYKTHAQKLTRPDFNTILYKIWPRCMSQTNIISGFRATGLYPLNPDILPETAFAPSVLTNQEDPEPVNDNNSKQSSPISIMCDEDIQNLIFDEQNNSPSLITFSPSQRPLNLGQQPQNTTLIPSPESQYVDKPCSFSINSPIALKKIVDYSSSTDVSNNDSSDHPICAMPLQFTPPENTLNQYGSSYKSPIPSTSGYQPKKKILRSISFNSNSDEDMFPEYENMTKLLSKPRIQPLQIYSSDAESEDNIHLSESSSKTQFQQFMPTPNYAITKSKHRKKAINYKGTRITKDLFKDSCEKEKVTLKTHNKNKGKKAKKQVRKIKQKGKENKNEGWYCYACHEESISDMRKCNFCTKWYHEECIGMTKNDSEEFLCPGGCG